MILKRGRRFHSLYTHLNYLNTNQNLIIEPGVFNEFLNDSISYNRTKQNISKNSFNFNAFYKFSFALKNWIMELKPEVEIEDGKMQTSIFKDNIMLTTDSLISNKRWLMVIPSITPNLRFKSSSLNANINVPIDYRIVNESDVLYASNKQTFTNIKPSVGLDYQINSSWESSLNLFYSHNLSHPSDVLNGYTIKSHTLIYRNNYFNTGKQTYLSGKIKYANPITGIEWRASYSKKYILNDYILDKQLTGQGILNYTYRKLDNTKIIDNLETVFSYFWADLSSSFNIKFNYVSIEADQLFSGNVYKTFNYWNSFNGSADIMFFDNLQIKYSFNLDLIKSSFRNVESHSRNFSHELEVTFYTNKKIYYGFEAEYYDFLDFSQSKGKTFFLNAYFSMKFANGRYVLDITCKNLLNSDSFDVYGMDQNMITYSTVLLRPRSFILTLKMPLTHLNGK